MIHEPRGAGSGQSTHPLSLSEKITHGGNRTRGSLPLAPWPEERQPTELPPPPPPPPPCTTSTTTVALNGKTLTRVAKPFTPALEQQLPLAVALPWPTAGAVPGLQEVQSFICLFQRKFAGAAAVRMFFQTRFQHCQCILCNTPYTCMYSTVRSNLHIFIIILCVRH